MINSTLDFQYLCNFNIPHSQILSRTRKAGSSLANCDLVSETLYGRFEQKLNIVCKIYTIDMPYVFCIENFYILSVVQWIGIPFATGRIQSPSDWIWIFYVSICIVWRLRFGCLIGNSPEREEENCFSESCSIFR